MLGAFSDSYRSQHLGSHSLGATTIGGLSNADADSGATLALAPDGQLMATYYDKSSLVVTATLIVGGKAGDPFSRRNPFWNPSGSWQLNNDPRNTPCSVYVPLAATTGPSPALVRASQNPDTLTTYSDCIIQNYVQCAFTSFHSTHEPQLLTQFWGCLFTVRGYNVGTLKPPTTTTEHPTVLSLLADTFPYPVPNPKVWGPDSPSGMVNWLLCSYEYLVGDDTEVDLEYRVRSSTGIRTAANLLISGVGGTEESSDTEGFGHATAESVITRKATSFAVTTKGLPHELASGTTTPATTDSLLLSGQGAYFGSAPPATIYADLTMVLLRNNSSAQPVMAAALRPGLDGSASAVAGEYSSYCYTPGNLLTYSEEAINYHMKQLYNRLKAVPDNDPLTGKPLPNDPSAQDFTFNHVSYASVYTDGNYVQEVVRRFGSECFGPSGTLPYLEFAFSETGIQRSEFQTTSRFTTGASSYVDGSLYAGMTWDLETEQSVGFLGITAIQVKTLQSEGFVMAGSEFSSEVVRSSTSASDWGVKLGEYLNPLAPGEAYTVRLYLLKPSPLWSREARAFSTLPAGAAVDVDSAPLRILFTVPYISDTLRDRLTDTFGTPQTHDLPTASAVMA